jgi:hypothetical protein
MKEDKMNIAHTILEQLGGNKFVAMTGAKNFGDVGNGLAFQLNSRMTKNKCNAVKITLDPSDTYTVKFLKIGKLELKTVAEYSNIYCDVLQDLFKRETGLEVSL